MITSQDVIELSTRAVAMQQRCLAEEAMLRSVIICGTSKEVEDQRERAVAIYMQYLDALSTTTEAGVRYGQSQMR